MSYKQRGGSQEFINLCSDGNLAGAQEYLRLNPDTDISANNDRAFRWACYEGHLDVAQWLLQVSKEKGQDIDISAGYEEAFRFACRNGHLDVAQWLRRVKPTINISAISDQSFRLACHNNHFDVAKWLATLNPTYEIINEDSPDWSCRILTDPKDIKWNKNKKLVWLESQKDNIVQKMPTDLVRITGSYL